MNNTLLQNKEDITLDELFPDDTDWDFDPRKDYKKSKSEVIEQILQYNYEYKKQRAEVYQNFELNNWYR